MPQAQQQPQQRRRRRTCLWIGGTSGLARTYWNEYCPSFIVVNDKRKNRDKPPRKNKTTTYHDNVDWIILGHEPKAPSWLHVKNRSKNNDDDSSPTATYFGLDFCQVPSPGDSKNNAAKSYLKPILDACTEVEDVILSIRPRLVSSASFAQAWESNRRMLQGLECFLQCLLNNDNNRKTIDNNTAMNKQQQRRQRRIIHVSSVAAVGHIQLQQLRSERDPDPASVELDNPYDRFKRATEEMVLQLAEECDNDNDNPNKSNPNNNNNLPEVTNLRLGAIFSDDKRCIQCNAMQLQARIGCYLHFPIDCNSSLNVAHLIQLMLLWDDNDNVNDDKSNRCRGWRPVYYYTRPTRYQQPVPYGAYLQDYRTAHGITWAALWIPEAWVQFLLTWFHAFCQWILLGRQNNGMILRRTIRGCLEYWLCLSHVDYLLQVTTNEHSFDLTAITTDFPTLAEREESIVECFQRRKITLGI